MAQVSLDSSLWNDIILSHFYCFRIYFHYLQVKILQCFYSHFKRYLFVILLLTVLSVLFNSVVNIIFPSVSTSVLMVPSYLAELGAVPHACISSQWGVIGVLLLNIPISFYSHVSAPNMPYSYMTSIQICFTITWHQCYS